MTLGVKSHRTGSLTIEKRNGSPAITGEPPELHVFPRKFLERELNDAIRLNLVIPSDPPITYEITSFDGPDLVGHKLPTPPKPKPKPSFWDRFRRKDT